MSATITATVAFSTRDSEHEARLAQERAHLVEPPGVRAASIRPPRGPQTKMPTAMTAT